MPYSRGNTPEPEVARERRLHRRQPPPPTPPAGGQPTPAASSARSQTRAPDGGQLALGGRHSAGRGRPGKFHVPSMTPGQAIQQSMRNAAKGGYHPGSGSGGGGDSNMEFNNLHPNFSTEMPTILSDTRGVDFGPYLARIVYHRPAELAVRDSGIRAPGRKRPRGSGVRDP